MKHTCQQGGHRGFSHTALWVEKLIFCFLLLFPLFKIYCYTFICFVGLNIGLSDYYLVHIFLHSLCAFLHRYLQVFIFALLGPFFGKWKNLQQVNCFTAFMFFTLLLFYAFKTLCFYSKLSVCKPDFLFCLDTFFTTCTKILRQIKRLI